MSVAIVIRSSRRYFPKGVLENIATPRSRRATELAKRAGTKGVKVTQAMNAHAWIRKRPATCVIQLTFEGH
jgi:hypothetical protein